TAAAGSATSAASTAIPRRRTGARARSLCPCRRSPCCSSNAARRAAVPSKTPADGTRRAVIGNGVPIVDCGRHAVQRRPGHPVGGEADAYADGHERLRCLLLHRPRGAPAWTEVEMAALGNDRWRAAFPVPAIGAYEYTVTAWIDSYASWRHDLERWGAEQ